MKISTMLKLLVLLLLGVLASGCATLDKNECLVANWETIGYEDGTKGRPASWIGRHRSACAKYNVAPDLALYTKGRNQGLVQYCRADVGYREGVNGKKYQNVCPTASERKFLSGYDYGLRIYKVKSRIRSLGYRVRKEENVLDELAESIAATEAELIRSGVSRSRRAILLEKLKHLSKESHDSEALIANLADQRDRANHELIQLQERNPYEI